MSKKKSGKAFDNYLTKSIDFSELLWYNEANIEGVIPQVFCELLSPTEGRKPLAKF